MIAKAISVAHTWRGGTIMASTMERAFELARSGGSASVVDIRRQLVREHHSDVTAHLGGVSVKRQLKIIIAAKAAEIKSIDPLLATDSIMAQFVG